MAIYYLAVKTLCRNPKHGESRNVATGSCVNRAAYMTRMSLEDERTGKTHNHRHGNSRKAEATIDLGIRFAGRRILTDSKERKNSYSDFWSKVEFAEKRKDARTGRSMIIALPRELDVNNQILAVQRFQDFLISEYKIGVHAAIHLDDKNNPHGHILSTTRELDARGELGQKVRSLDEPKRAHYEIEKIKKAWADICNELLKPHKITLDHRSYQRQGVSKKPQIHQGPAQHHLAQREKAKLDEEIEILTAEVKKDGQVQYAAHSERLGGLIRPARPGAVREDQGTKGDPQDVRGLQGRGDQGAGEDQRMPGRSGIPTGQGREPGFSGFAGEDEDRRKRAEGDLGAIRKIENLGNQIANRIRLKRFEMAKRFYDRKKIIELGQKIANRLRMGRYERTANFYKQSENYHRKHSISQDFPR